MKRLLRRWFGNAAPSGPQDRPPADVQAIVRLVQPFTMTGWERIWALVEAVRYVARADIPGAFVECGVWRGGSVMAMIEALKSVNACNRDLYLYDTFEGMTKPLAVDASDYSPPALQAWSAAQSEQAHPWNRVFDPALLDIASMRSGLAALGYPEERLKFVKGPVEETIPGTLPDRIALLRLDTDWYESTRHELEHLYPRLAPGGVLIIDDYGHWKGCRQAVDEYFSSPGVKPVLLQRIDYTARLAIKV